MVSIIAYSLLLMTPPYEKGRWPVGYADFMGELSLTEAVKLSSSERIPDINSLDECKKLLVKRSNEPLIWKKVVDEYVKAGKIEMFLQTAQTLIQSQEFFKGDSNGKIISKGYGLSVVRDRLQDLGEPGKAMSEKYSKLLLSAGAIPSFANDSKAGMLVKLILSYGNVLQMRNQAAIWNNRVGNNYFGKYCLADSNRFGRYSPSPSGGTRRIEPNQVKLLEEYSNLAKSYPERPTPQFALYITQWSTNNKEAREHGARYLQLEKRPFKSEWVQRVRKSLAEPK